MKKIMFAVLFAGVLSACESEKTIPASEVPEPVLVQFAAKYPGAAIAGWSLEGEKYEATFTLDGKTMEAEFQKDGTFIKEEK